MDTASSLSTATLNDEFFEELTNSDRAEVSNNVIKADQDETSLVWHIPAKPYIKGHTLYIQPRGVYPVWLGSVVDQLDHLLNLGENWDSYGSCTIDLSVVERVIRFLGQVLDDESVNPDIVPTSEGGIQLEWDYRDKELELEFRPSGDYVVFFLDPHNHDEEARELEEEYHASYNFYIAADRLLKEMYNAGV